MRLQYRHKVLLALLEAFGGELGKRDCEKILFLFCKRSNKNYYDFFPYRYGCFSITSYVDRKKLLEAGYLTDSDGFKLVSSKDGRKFVHQVQLSKEEQNSLTQLVSDVKNVRGNELVRKVYLEYPQYVLRSQIAQEVLTPNEYASIQQTWEIESSPALLTVGYEGLSIDAYLNILIKNNVTALIDVRKNPVSMKFGFAKNRLWEYVDKVGIAYYHLPNLGVPSHLRQNLSGKNEEYSKLFEYYDKQILPTQTLSINAVKVLSQEYDRVALTCFEADPCFCHRHRLAAHLEKSSDFSLPVIHLAYSGTETENVPA